MIVFTASKDHKLSKFHKKTNQAALIKTQLNSTADKGNQWQCAKNKEAATSWAKTTRCTREIWRGAERGGGLLLEQREPQIEHRHVDTRCCQTGLKEGTLLLTNSKVRWEQARHYVRVKGHAAQCNNKRSSSQKGARRALINTSLKTHTVTCSVVTSFYKRLFFRERVKN